MFLVCQEVFLTFFGILGIFYVVALICACFVLTNIVLSMIIVFLPYAGGAQEVLGAAPLVNHPRVWIVSHGSQPRFGWGLLVLNY